MPYCVVPKCRNTSTNSRLYRIPVNRTRRYLWVQAIKALKKPDWKFCEGHRVCQAHFTEDCFFPNTLTGGRFRLRPDAIPTIFPGNEVRMTAKERQDKINETAETFGMPVQTGGREVNGRGPTKGGQIGIRTSKYVKIPTLAEQTILKSLAASNLPNLVQIAENSAKSVPTIKKEVPDVPKPDTTSARAVRNNAYFDELMNIKASTIDGPNVQPQAPSTTTTNVSASDGLTTTLQLPGPSKVLFMRNESGGPTKVLKLSNKPLSEVLKSNPGNQGKKVIIVRKAPGEVPFKTVGVQQQKAPTSTTDAKKPVAILPKPVAILPKPVVIPLNLNPLLLPTNAGATPLFSNPTLTQPTPVITDVRSESKKKVVHTTLTQEQLEVEKLLRDLIVKLPKSIMIPKEGLSLAYPLLRGYNLGLLLQDAEPLRPELPQVHWREFMLIRIYPDDDKNESRTILWDCHKGISRKHSDKWARKVIGTSKAKALMKRIGKDLDGKTKLTLTVFAVDSKM